MLCGPGSPLPHGSRFGTRAERGIWYGADALPTALAEAAYYRLVFLEGTDADIEPILVDLSAFRVPVRTDAGVDLTRAAFAEREGDVSSPGSYAAAQTLGRVLREARVEAFRYRSARDPAGGANVGLFTPAAFAARDPGPARDLVLRRQAFRRRARPPQLGAVQRRGRVGLPLPPRDVRGRRHSPDASGVVPSGAGGAPTGESRSLLLGWRLVVVVVLVRSRPTTAWQQ